MPNKTYILLSRSILDSEVFASEKMLKVWIWCLCKANHKTRYFPVNTGKGQTTVKVARGDFIFGRNTAADSLRMNGNTIYKIMKRLEKIGNVVINSNNQYSVVSICNYASYQDPESYKVTTKEQPSNNQVTTKEQPSNTDNNVNNVNNVNNENKRAWFVDWLNYRKSIKKPITVEATFDSLVKRFNSEPIDKIKWVVTYSIEGGYQGLFWDKHPTSKPISDGRGVRRTHAPISDERKKEYSEL